MKINRMVPLAATLFLAAVAYAQNNTCAYTFSYPQYDFSFCLNIWGTLSSIQSPIGVNHLDATNPVEGWSSYILDDGGGQDGGPMIPGLDAFSSTSPPTIRQPNGPGTLPLFFVYANPNYIEMVNALPQQKLISLSLRIESCRDCYWFGTVSRVANIRADGNSTSNFAHSAYAAFGYVQHGVMLETAAPACADTDPNGASANTYMSCSTTDTPFTGPGAVFASWAVSSDRGSPAITKATYRVF